jgi:ribosomal protein L11 methylase PrmA
MKPAFDPGSFKDPEGRVFLAHEQVYRTLSPAAAKRMTELAASGTIAEFVAAGLLVPSNLVAAAGAGLDPATVGETVMWHERVPLVSYPFEWSFEMLRDGALLTLDLLESCLNKNLTLKDATAYNVVPYNGGMVFFDTLSIDRYVPGSPWEGYSQFCREFLFPLMLTAYRGVEFQAWFRGGLDGIPVSDFARMLAWTDMFRGGVLKHVILQSKLEKSFANRDVKVRANFDASTFSKDLILANVRNLRGLIKKLRYRAGDSEWIGYATENSYTDEAARQKGEFVERAVKKIGPRRVVDLGGNTGDFSLIAARHAKLVTTIDIDATCIDALYRRGKSLGVTNVVPMVGNLLNPTPGLGWGLCQRQPLFGRIRSDAFLGLALIHHLRIGGNVPLEACLDQFREIAPAGVLEWVGRDDSMVKQMLRNRADVFTDYEWCTFETLVRERFVLSEVVESHDGARKLCLLLPRS